MKIKWHFILLSLLTIFESFCLIKLLNINQLLNINLTHTLKSDDVEKYLNFRDKWAYISYLLIPIIILVKVVIISSILYIGTFIFNEKKIKFKQLFHISIKAEYLFLLAPIFKIIWFYFFQTNYTLEDIQYFYPFSALNIVGYKGLEPWLIYPFQILNLFELAYWLILAYFIGKITETNMDRGLKIVASSYGSALLLWVVVIMFFTLNYS
jgi:hypothetical protein